MICKRIHTEDSGVKILEHLHVRVSSNSSGFFGTQIFFFFCENLSNLSISRLNPPFQGGSNDIRVTSRWADFANLAKNSHLFQTASMCLKIDMNPFGITPNRLPVSERTRNQIFLVKNQILASDQLPDLSFPREIKRNEPRK